MTAARRPDLTLWGRTNSFNVQKALWILAELDLPFRHIDAGGAAGKLDTPAYRAMNPHGRVPVLQDGDAAIWESHAIVRYVAAAYGQGALWDADPAVRARADGWMDWSQATLQPDFVALFWGYYRTPPARRDAAAIDAARRRCERHFALLDEHLGRVPYLAGQAFSIGDIPAGALMYRYFEMGVPTPPLPAVRRWYDRLAARPAYAAHVMAPFDDLKGRLAF